MVHARILGIAGYLPHRVETNDDLAAENPDWDMQRIAGKTGIVSRHIAADGETSLDLGLQASQRLLERNIVELAAIDYVIVCSQTPDRWLPSDACVVQHRLGLGTHVGAFDFRLGCSGFVCGLQLAKALVETSAARNVLLITGETYSKLVHPKDRTVRALFGDGAAATLVGIAEAEQTCIGPFVTGTDGSGAQCLTVPSGGFRLPKSDATAIEHTDATGSIRSDDHLFMDGQAIFAFALNQVPKLVTELLGKAGLAKQDIDWWVFHQANRFMIENLAICCGLEPSRVVYAMENVGNTVSASIPLAIEQSLADGKIQPGHKLALVGFGVGLSWNACVLQW
ncbi:MAG: ketoacyl-ACP synthase III [Planctomycetales bacterium]|nr:ketoacyl-ACP synthase III [Planctomycetales bacterium]